MKVIRLISHHIWMFALGHATSFQWVPLSLVFPLQTHHHRNHTSKRSHEDHTEKQGFSHSAADHSLLCQWTMWDCSGQRETQEVCFSPQIELAINTEHESESLLSCPSAITSTSTVAEAASPDS